MVKSQHHMAALYFDRLKNSDYTCWELCALLPAHIIPLSSEFIYGKIVFLPLSSSLIVILPLLFQLCIFTRTILK